MEVESVGDAETTVNGPKVGVKLGPKNGRFEETKDGVRDGPHVENIDG
jgi:hypothetical protein